MEVYMKKSSIQKLLGGALMLFLVASPAAKVFAHEAECPHCGLDIVQNTATQDNETALMYGKKRIEYRCVLCAIADGDKSYKGDLTVLVPSETKGKPIEIARKDGKWSAPEGTILLGQKVKHKYCQTGYRAFRSQSAFDAHVQKNKILLMDAKAITLAELVDLAHADTMKVTSHKEGHQESHEGAHKE
jgi:hypothetical protein